MTGPAYDADGDVDVRLVLYQRRSLASRGRRLWGWRAVHANGNVLATDGGQGYARRSEAERVAWNLLHGQYRVGPG